MNDDNLHSLHGQANDALVRLLSERVSTMRSGASDISEAIESRAGGAPVPTDAPGQVDAPADSGCSKSGGVKV